MGHAYYFNVIKGYEKLISQEPMFIEDSFSTPIWFDKTLRDCTYIAKGGREGCLTLIMLDDMGEGGMYTFDDIIILSKAQI